MNSNELTNTFIYKKEKKITLHISFTILSELIEFISQPKCTDLHYFLILIFDKFGSFS